MAISNLKYLKCNLCGSRDYKIHFKGSKEKKKTLFSATSQVYSGEQIVKCNNCSLVYINPRPFASKIIQGYSQEKESMYIKDAKTRSASFKRTLKVVKRYRKEGRLLDVGCAAGLFLKVAKDGGFDVYGIEPNKWLARWGKKNLSVEIIPKPFEETDFTSDSFDIVCFWDTLEHLTNPFLALEKTHKILKSEGILVINFPDIDTFFAKVLGKNWWFITSGHLYYFSTKTLSQMLKKTGFEVLESHSHFQFLSLSYLLTRLGRYHQRLGETLSNYATKVGLGGIVIPYYAGQKTIIAKRILD